MNLLDLIVERAEGLRHDEEVPFDADFPTDQEKLWFAISEAEHLYRAARDLVDALKGDFAKTLTENESVRFGEFIYKISPDRREKITDPDALIDFLGDLWHHVVPVTSSTRLRKGGIKAVCERHGIDPKVFEETFIDVEWGDPKLQAIPVSKAPKYAAALNHGESTFGRKSKPTQGENSE